MRYLATILLSLLFNLTLHAQKASLLAGPMLGYADYREAAVWVQTSGAAKVMIQFSDSANPKAVRQSEVQSTMAKDFYCTTFILTNLEPGRKYKYDVVIDGKKVALPYPTVLQTLKLWAFRSEPPTIKLATGSCFYTCDSAYDRPGKCYGSEFEIMQSIHKDRPDVMLWLGDNCYMREVDWNTRNGMAYRQSHARKQKELQPLLASTHHYATWDDHDYGPNDADRSFVGKRMSEEVFKKFWANPNYDATGLGGVTGQFEWGDVQVFLLDDRYHRAPNDDKDTAKAYFGDAQIQWLKDALTGSRATFKIIASGGQMISPARVYENMAQYPVERRKFLDAIAQSGASGVLLLSGDRHHTELMKLDRAGSYPLYELTASSLTAGTADPKEVNPIRIDGTLIKKQHNYAMLTFTGPRTSRTLSISMRDVQGKEIWKRDIAASELRVAK